MLNLVNLGRSVPGKKLIKIGNVEPTVSLILLKSYKIKLNYSNKKEKLRLLAVVFYAIRHGEKPKLIGTINYTLLNPFFSLNPVS